jgi:hypothetical protein
MSCPVHGLVARNSEDEFCYKCGRKLIIISTESLSIPAEKKTIKIPFFDEYYSKSHWERNQKDEWARKSGYQSYTQYLEDQNR